MGQPTRERKIFLLVVSAFLCVAAIAVGVPMFAKALIGGSVARRVIRARASEVSWISLRCDDGEELSIHERESIATIVSALNDSEEYAPNHPQCRMRCTMAIHHDAKSDTAPVRWGCTDPRDGALIYLYSQGTWGFSLGIWTSPRLEDAIYAAQPAAGGRSFRKLPR